MKLVKLEVSTFRGISFDAEHWYGKISYRKPFGSGHWSSADPVDFKTTEVMNKLTQEEADKLTEKDGWTWDAGMENSRFDTLELLDSAAIPIFEEHFDPTEDTLVRVYNDAVHWIDDRPRKIIAGKFFDQFKDLDHAQSAKLAEELGIDYLITMF